MMNKKLCVVVIPIHKENPSHYDLISFGQCFNVLSKYDIKVIIPRGLNIGAYLKVKSDFEVIEIDATWLSSVERYNKLKLSRFFYDLFEHYQFLLTYELDAFIFKDDIEYWCSKDYDFIGAPWFYGHSEPASLEIIGVGNSGFSLRKIKSIKNAINSIYFEGDEINASSKKRKIVTYFKKIVFHLNIFKKENKSIQDSSHFNEDWFISEVIPKHIKSFKVAPIEDAIRFSFEVKPDYLFQINKKELPMGCHAWHRYNLDFWKPHIMRFGHKL